MKRQWYYSNQWKSEGWIKIQPWYFILTIQRTSKMNWNKLFNESKLFKLHGVKDQPPVSVKPMK